MYIVCISNTAKFTLQLFHFSKRGVENAHSPPVPEEETSDCEELHAALYQLLATFQQCLLQMVHEKIHKISQVLSRQPDIFFWLAL